MTQIPQIGFSFGKSFAEGKNQRNLRNLIISVFSSSHLIKPPALTFNF